MFKIRNEYARMMSVGCFAVLMINFELFRGNPVRDKSKNNLDFDPNTFSLVSQKLQSEPSAKSNLSQQCFISLCLNQALLKTVCQSAYLIQYRQLKDGLSNPLRIIYPYNMLFPFSIECKPQNY